MAGEGEPTVRADYTARLVRLGSARWKRLLNVQAPYRWNLRRLDLGRTLDVGCGIGRNLAHLPPGSVGVDHNPDSVAIARAAGLAAYAVGALPPGANDFDSLLFAHVLEHVADPVALVRMYLPLGRPGGRVVLITPQEAGFRSDPSHVGFVDLDALVGIMRATGCRVDRSYSFPLPRWAGRAFRHNEFVVVGRTASSQAAWADP